MEEVLTAPQSPWQNPYAERLIGSIRRECLNHFVILNARHLKRTLASYFATTTNRGPIWASISNVHFLGRSRAPERSSKSRNSAVCITVMNALQLDDMPADAFLAKDTIWGWTSNAQFHGRCRVSERSSKSRISVVCITEMNALLLNDMFDGYILANDTCAAEP